ncbi:MAG: hypothetical protein EHM93_08235 [Bacteroidales bacterium]|nr:MAG: hypothetical protein EHM93_08235 [Bacteroidales bacterium]
MDLIELKIKLHQMCVEKQRDILDNAKAAMDEAQIAANEYGAPRDRYDSFRAQLLRKRDLHAAQYEKAMNELDFLEKLDPSNQNKELTINTLVITNKQKFYVSIGIGKITLPEGEFYAISPLAPIFQTLKGKTTGDTVVFNGQKITILELI